MRGFALVLASFVAGASITAGAGYLIFAKQSHANETLPPPIFGALAGEESLAADRVFWFKTSIPKPTPEDDRLYVPPRASGFSPDMIEHEKRVVSAAKGQAMRHGDRLWLGFDNGTSMLMIDAPICDTGGYCTTYRLESFEQDIDLFIVKVPGWEWFDALVISKQDGAITRTANLPVFSPDRKNAIVNYVNKTDGAGEFSIYRMSGGHLLFAASCDGALKEAVEIKWVAPDKAVLRSVSSPLPDDALPFVQLSNGKWHVRTKSSDFECVVPPAE